MTPPRPGERLRDAHLKSTTQFKTNPEYIRVGGPRLHQRRLPHDQLQRLIHNDIDRNPELDINKARHRETTGLAPETGSASYFQAFIDAIAGLPDPVELLKTASNWLATFLPHAETDRKDPAEKAASSAPSIPGAKREVPYQSDPPAPNRWHWSNMIVSWSRETIEATENIGAQLLADPNLAIKSVFRLERIIKTFYDDYPTACGITPNIIALDKDVFSYPVLVDDRLLPRAWRTFYAIHSRFHAITGHRGPVPVMVMPPLSCDPNRTASTASFNPASCEMFKEGDLVLQIDEFFSVNRTDKSVMGMVFVEPKTILRWVNESSFLKQGQGQIALAIVVFDEVFDPPIHPMPQIDNKEPVRNEPNLIISLAVGYTVGMSTMLGCAFAIKGGAAKRCIRKIRGAN